MLMPLSQQEHISIIEKSRIWQPTTNNTGEPDQTALLILVRRQTIPEDAGIAYIVASLGAVVIDVALDGID